MTPREWNRRVKALARQAGFDRCGVAAAKSIERAQYLRVWLDAGRAGSMRYLHRYFEQRSDPRALLEGARSVIVVAQSYHQHPPEAAKAGESKDDLCRTPSGEGKDDLCRTPSGKGKDDLCRTSSGEGKDDLCHTWPRGRVAMYAWGEDYHHIIKSRLHAMADAVRDACGEMIATKVCVDTAPLLEREFAAAAGIGWIGKNTLVVNQQLGSYFFLGAIVTTLEIEPDAPVPDRCGTCTRCLHACPSGAFTAPYQMDASRCVSYLTIEHREPIPGEFHAAIDDWVFGCDVCQQVCPYNQSAPMTREPRLAVRPPGPNPVLQDMLAWSIDDYRRILAGSAMKRATLEMLRRNARIAQENARRRAGEQDLM